MDTSVAVVIVAYNSGSLLNDCVAALRAQTHADFQAVIWDNASTDGAVGRLDLDERFRVIRGEENLGFAAANNRAAALIRSRYVATLNPDAFPEKDWLEKLLAAAEETGAEAVASLQIDAEAPEILDGAGDCMSVAGIAWRGGYRAPVATAPKERVEVFAACAAAALYRRDAFDHVGGFEERFFCYFEDVDLGFRLRLSGGRCVLEPRAVVRHVGSASTGKGSAFSEYHGARNRLWTFMRDMPLWLMPLAAPAHVLVTAYVLLRSPHLLEPRCRGLRDAWRGRRPFLAERRPVRFSRDLVRILTWSPVALSRRAVKALPLKG